MINIEKMGKLRVFVVAKDDRKPVPGVRVTLSAITEVGAIVPLATLSSDHAGYVSFSITRIVARGLSTVRDLLVEVDGDTSSQTSVCKWLGVEPPSGNPEFVPPPSQPKPGCMALTIVTVLENTANSADCSCNATPAGTSVQEPDACDYELSPNSFLIRPAVRTGEGDCERIVPASLPVNRYSIREVVIRSPKPSLPTKPGIATDGVPTHTGNGIMKLPVSSHFVETINASESLPGVDMAPVDTYVGQIPRHGMRFGELLEYEQTWFSLGHSLGEIKYSLALAPGEATQVAVIDWSRTDSIMRADQVDSTEQLRHQQGFDRQIDEAVNAALSEKQGGGSFQAGLGAAASGTFKGINLGGDLALGGAVTNSWGNRDLSADSLQDVHAKVMQASTLTRSLTSTVVVQASQAERNTLSTRAVANHNHCHALTIVYYEVLRHLHVRTALRNRRWVVMIPFAFIEFSKVDNILRFRAALEPSLLDSKRAEGFEALERINSNDYFDWPVPSTNNGSPTGTAGATASGIGSTANGTSNNPISSQTPVQQFEVTLRTSSWNWSSTYGEIVVEVLNKRTNIWTQIWEKKRVTDNGPELNKITFPQTAAKPGWFAEDIGDVQVGWREDNGMDSWDFAGITVRYKLDNGWFTLVDSDGQIEFDHGLLGGKMKVICNFDNAPTMIYSPAQKSTPYTPNPKANPSSPDSSSQLSSDERKQLAALRREADEGAFTRLKNHLMMNEGYYSRIVWMNMDRSERQVILESALENSPELFMAIDDRPVAVSGNRVAFAFAGDPPAWLGALSRETPLPEESIVTFPTPGIFAEAQLGQCNACEKRDVTRMWNWAELPTEQLPQIEGISPGPRGQTPNVQPAQLPANVLNVVSTPSVPDPTGLAVAINAVTKGDSFRDMSGLAQVSDLLGKLASGAVDLVKGQQGLQQAAADAKQKVDSAMGNGSAISNKQPSADNSGPSAADLKDRFSLVPDIKDFAKEFELNSDERKQFALHQVYGTKPSGILLEPKSTAPSKNTKLTPVEIKLRCFIPSELAAFSGPGPAIELLLGNKRDFDYSKGTSFAEIKVTFQLDLDKMDVIDLNTKSNFGIYEWYLRTDATHTNGKPDWWFEKSDPGATPISGLTGHIKEDERQISAAVDSAGASVKTRLSIHANPFISGDARALDTVRNIPVIGATIAGAIASLLSLSPDIDLDLMVTISKRNDGVAIFTVSGTHDGFPSYELYVNHVDAYRFSAETSDPTALFGSGDITVSDPKTHLLEAIPPQP